METSNLENGRLLLVSTRGPELEVRQVKVDLTRLTPTKSGLVEAEKTIRKLAESNSDVREFLAGEKE